MLRNKKYGIGELILGLICVLFSETELETAIKNELSKYN
jgi:hypothetical protein